jgi:hypothetical protein
LAGLCLAELDESLDGLDAVLEKVLLVEFGHANANDDKKDKHDIGAGNVGNMAQASVSTLMPHCVSLSSIYRHVEDVHDEAGV